MTQNERTTPMGNDETKSCPNERCIYPADCEYMERQRRCRYEGHCSYRLCRLKDETKRKLPGKTAKLLYLCVTEAIYSYKKGKEKKK